MVVQVLAIVQARMGSTRLPGKVLKLVNGKPLIEILLHRLSNSKIIDKIVLATSESEDNNELANFVRKLGYEIYRGNENNVLDRYYHAAKKYQPEIVVRVTGDCPIIDPELVDDVIGLYLDKNVDYACNTQPPTFPDGLDTEVFSFQALETAFKQTVEKFDIEHVTPFIRRSGQFKRANYLNAGNYSEERWTVDEPEDFEVISKILDHFSPNLDFTWQDVLDLKKTQPDYFAANRQITRNEGASLGTGQKLWKRAKNCIPGGNMLLSKRAEMFLPDLWPAYYSKVKGCKVWDLDGNEYIDMSIMGIGTNILGYGHPEVDEVVRKVVEQGNMSTLNCPEEVYLAERLVELHPWADMVRFARTGGEVNAIAVRIARAASGKDKVAICGYHGWHDWYLAANLSDDSQLDGHLLPGLEPNGVPRCLKGTTLPFTYNRINELEQILVNHDIGVIKMEVSRNVEPEKGFLEKVRELATIKGIVLVFDECTSGFRETFGGLHKKYGVEPDMAIFGKAMGNGYAITAVIGRREIMEAAQRSFISSTFWTERIGPTAGLKTLEIMEREKSWEFITATGKSIGERWKQLAEKHEIPIRVFGHPALIKFAIESPNAISYKTLITQEMLVKGYLAGNSVYVCTKHIQDVLDGYFDVLDSVFALIHECEEGRDVTSLLKAPVCHAEFRRLN